MNTANNHNFAKAPSIPSASAMGIRRGLAESLLKPWLRYLASQPRAAIWALAGALFILGFSLRLIDLALDTPQPDELHWLERSADTLQHLRNRDYARFNFHLAHPGVPPSLIYSGIIWATQKYNSSLSLHLGEPGYLDYLWPCRVANALTSSLVLPLLFFGCARFLGFQVATLATLLFLMAPTHVAASRQVHLDSLLTLFVTITWILYLKAETKASVMTRLISGATWGLAIATKPTAGFLLPALLAFRTIYNWTGSGTVSTPDKRNDTVTDSLFAKLRYLMPRWSDVWTLLVGHIVLALLWSRLWHFQTPYITDFHLDNWLTKSLDNISEAVRMGGLGPSLLALTIFFWAVKSWHYRFTKPSQSGFNCSMAGLLLSVVLFIASVVPSLLGNLVRFWMRAAGLSTVAHVAYGQKMAAPVMGYHWLMATRLPLFVLAGLALWLLLAYWFWRRLLPREKVFSLFAILAVVTWVSLLAVSPKQTMRYALPILPLVYVLAAQGLMESLRTLILQPWGLLAHRPIASRGLAYGFLITALLVQAGELAAFHPHFALFRNLASSGIAEDMRYGIPIPATGIDEGLRFLANSRANPESDLSVLVLGDTEVLNYAFTHRTWGGGSGKLRFVNYALEADAPFLIVFPGFHHVFLRLPDAERAHYHPAFSFSFRNVALLSVYKKDIPIFSSPQRIVYQGGHNTGQIKHLPEGRALLALPEKDRRGFLFFGQRIRFHQGSYLFALPARLLDREHNSLKTDPSPPLVPTTLAFKVEIGENCIKTVNAEELTNSTTQTLTWTCAFDKDVSLSFRVFWFGKIGVWIDQLTVQQVDAALPIPHTP